jgi:hypothetical protein
MSLPTSHLHAVEVLDEVKVHVVDYFHLALPNINNLPPIEPTTIFNLGKAVPPPTALFKYTIAVNNR